VEDLNTKIGALFDDLCKFMTSENSNKDKLDPVRAALLTAAKENGESLASLSNSLGMNPAYLQQFVRRGSPKRLPEEIRHDLAQLLSIEESELGGIERDSVAGTSGHKPSTVSHGHRKSLRGFAVRLSVAREKAGYYSQSKFALEAEIPLSRYVVLERGDDDPTIAELVSISATAGISLNWLVKG
jgi:hypothetical protein